MSVMTVREDKNSRPVGNKWISVAFRISTFLKIGSKGRVMFLIDC